MTTSEIERLNADSANLALRVSSLGALLTRLGQDIPDDQQIREFLHNALQAVARVGGGRVTITSVRRFGANKLAFVDTGCGMAPTELRDLVGQLMASATRVGDSRFGLGAKITGLVHNPVGVEYTTLVAGERDGVRATLGVDPLSGEIGWLGGGSGAAFSVVPRAQLPIEIRQAGHGTVVALLGVEPGQDTLALGCGLAAGERRFETYVNSRYASLPPAIEVWAANGLEGRSDHRRVFGLRPVLEAAADEATQGVVDLPAGRVRWYYSVPEEGRGIAARDNAPVRRSLSLCLPDPEVEGLTEIYTLLSGRAAMPALASFGLGEISGRVALLVEPRGVRANHERTMLMHRRTNTPYSLTKIAGQFKENLPARLVELIEEQIANVSFGDDDRLQQYVSRHPELLRSPRLRRDTLAPALSAGGGGRSRTGTATLERPPRAPRPRAKGTGSRSGPVVEFARPVPWTEEDFANEPRLRGYLGRYEEVSNILYYNPESIDTDREVRTYTDGRRLSSLDYAVARRTVLVNQINRMRLSILRWHTRFLADPDGYTASDRELAFSEWALTEAGAQASFGAGDTRREITLALGGGGD